MTSLDQRLIAVVVLVLALLVATTTLYALGVEMGALYIGGMLTLAVGFLVDMIRGKASIEKARRSGYHVPITPVPPADEADERYLPEPPPLPQRREDTAKHGKREPTGRRDPTGRREPTGQERLTPVGRELTGRIALKDWTGALEVVEALPTERERTEARTRVLLERDRARELDDIRKRSRER